MTETPLDRAIRICGGSQGALAERIGRTQQYISWLALKAKRIPAEVAIDIERATEGQVPRHEIRPDVFEPPVGV